jgi:hypothetical protein
LHAANELVLDHKKTLRLARPLQCDLSAWHDGFHQPLESENDLTTVSTINILGFHFTQINIFRAILRPFFANGRQLESDLSPEEVETIRVCRLGTRECVEATLKFIEQALWSDIIIPDSTKEVTLTLAAREASTSARVGYDLKVVG